MSLDERLKQLVMRHGWITESDNWQQAVDDIKQAFIDGGYIKIPQVELSTPNYSGYKPKEEIFTVMGKEVMTGAEWYERFMEEVKRPRKLGVAHNEAEVRSKIEGWVTTAAKRASGVLDD